MTDVISQILNVLLLVIAIALIGIVVIQRNEGGLGGLGGSSGGGMGGLMTGRAAANFLTKVTRWLAVGFFGVTLALAWIASHRSAPQSLTAPVSQEAPAAPAAPAETGGTTAPATDGSAGGTTGGTANSTGGGATDYYDASVTANHQSIGRHTCPRIRPASRNQGLPRPPTRDITEFHDAVHIYHRRRGLLTR